jgi:geranylgeranyl pyrophosphate synthase
MIYQKIEPIWKENNAWPGYLQAMHALIDSFTPKSSEGNKLLAKYAALPGLCCLAAGGQADWAEELTAAWLLFYGAAYIMDTIEDGDEPSQEWAGLSPGMAVNAASGIYFTASAMLQKIKTHPAVQQSADEVIAGFYQSFLTMSSGQHRDLSTPSPSLNEYWEIAQAKSGAFFAAASWCGAHLATGDRERLKGFRDFGSALGLLIQILDDIDDIKKAPSAKNWSGLRKSLPVIYAFQHGGAQARQSLEELLQAQSPTATAGNRILDLIDDTGAVKFLIREYDRISKTAEQALHHAGAIPPFSKTLMDLIPRLH